MKILMVDDDIDLLFIGQRMLSNAGHHVSILSHCHLLFKLLDEELPDLIILDINLGDCNGISLCKKIRQSAAYDGVVVVLFSSDFHEQSVCRLCNAHFFVQKPFTQQALTDCVNRYNTLPLTG